MLRLERVEDEKDIDIVKILFKEYLEELNENLDFQKADDELLSPLKKYGPPHGSLLVAYFDNEPAGCIALQPLKEDGVCEMKRLFVRPQYRKHGLGEYLVEALLADANAKAYKKMVLDTLERLQPAIKLYLKYGFENTSAYYENPLPDVVYMQKFL